MVVFFVLFFLSGFCSLVYQVVWLRVAMASFGVTTPMVSIVLSIFMAGLALGSWVGGRMVKAYEERRSSKFFISSYGLIELLIGVSGLAVAPLLRLGRTFLSNPGGSWASPGYYLVSAAWVALVMLPFCTCMGATFPLAMAGIRSLFREKSSSSFSYLYLGNVLGAMAGALGSAFVFIEELGFSDTLLIAATCNAAIAALALLVAVTKQQPVGAAVQAGRSENRRVDLGGDTKSGSAVDVLILFTSGLASLGMEVVWTRQFMPLLGPVVYSFAAMLAVYLGATAIGSRIYRAWLQTQSKISARLIIGAATTVSGGFAFLPLLATDPRMPGHAYVYHLVLVVCGLAPFCGVLGFMTPMLVDRWSHGNPNRAGRAYAINAVGCILGPLLAGFILLPAFGERWSLFILALPFLGFGLWFWTAESAEGDSRRPALGPLLAATSAIVLLLMVATRDFETLFPEARVRRDYTATSIAAGTGMQRRLLVNGVGMTVLSPITKMMVHLPLTSLPAPPQRVLVLCFGMGTSFRSAMSWGLPVTVVELVPSVPRLFSYFHADADEVLRSGHGTIIIDDARRFLERTQQSFDVIVIDPPPPVAAAGSSLLYSMEFYQLARKHLRPGGILQQWLPAGDATVKSSFAHSLQDSFPYVRVFSSIEGWGYHFLGSESPLPHIPAEELAHRLPPTAARDLLEWGPASKPADQFQIVLDRERNVGDLIKEDPSAPLLTDDRPVNEYYLLRTLLSKNHGTNPTVSMEKGHSLAKAE